MCSVRAKSGCRIVKLLCPPLRCRMFRRKKLGNLAVFFERERLKLIASLTISFTNRIIPIRSLYAITIFRKI